MVSFIKKKKDTMPRQIVPVGILFADISGSSTIYEVLGDTAAQEAVGKILRRLSDVTRQFDGKVIKSVGDAILATFPSSSDSIDAAKAMQTSMKGMTFSDLMDPINIHIGLHYGPVVIENEDIFGDAVNVAARIVDYANPRQIVASRAVIDNLAEDSGHFTKYITKITAKNISGELELFEIIYEDQNTTMVIDCRRLSKVVCLSLYLTKEDQVFVVDVQKPVISVGRESFNDIAIHYSWISRTHAYIENRNGVFMIKDKSTNGTFIYPQDAEAIYLNKGEHPLSGKGFIIFGREKENKMKNSGLKDTIEYEIR